MIPMSRPGWFDELPESMSEAEYRELPEDIARTIEVVHGHVIKCESPAPRHNRIARRLAFALESARSSADPCLTGGGFTVRYTTVVITAARKALAA
jgi:hypothetical protein